MRDNGGDGSSLEESAGEAGDDEFADDASPRECYLHHLLHGQEYSSRITVVR
jgi:hypothetical protein